MCLSHVLELQAPTGPDIAVVCSPACMQRAIYRHKRTNYGSASCIRRSRYKSCQRATSVQLSNISKEKGACTEGTGCILNTAVQRVNTFMTAQIKTAEQGCVTSLTAHLHCVPCRLLPTSTASSRMLYKAVSQIPPHTSTVCCAAPCPLVLSAQECCTRLGHKSHGTPPLCAVPPPAHWYCQLKNAEAVSPVTPHTSTVCRAAYCPLVLSAAESCGQGMQVHHPEKQERHTPHLLWGSSDLSSFQWQVWLTSPSDHRPRSLVRARCRLRHRRARPWDSSSCARRAAARLARSAAQTVPAGVAQ